MSPDSTATAIATAFNSMGLPVFSVIDHAGLTRLATVADAAAVERYGLLASSGAVVVAFPYDPRYRGISPEIETDSETQSETEPGVAGPPPFARIGAFAAWNRYAALTRLLLGAGRLLAEQSGLPAKGFRAIVNSRLPEKRLAVMAGLGFVGRSSLVVTKEYGTACLLGALLLPPDFPMPEIGQVSRPVLDAAGLEASLLPGSGCGSCRACVDACPGSAIAVDGTGIQLDQCIQYWSTRAGAVPDTLLPVWGPRLYGCDDCVVACPRSSGAWSADALGTSPAERADGLFLPAERRPGRFVSAPYLETAGDDELKAFFRKTALGLSWMGLDEFRRNARLARACRSIGI